MAKQKKPRRGGLEPTIPVSVGAGRGGPQIPQGPAPEPPGVLRRMLRFSQLAGSRKGNADEVVALLLDELKDAGVPQAAIDRVEELGVKLLKQGGELPRSLSALAGSAENAQVMRASLASARTAYKGFQPGTLKAAFDQMLSVLKESGESPELIAELKKIGPERIAKVGMAQTGSVLARRGADPFVVTAFRKIAKKAPTPKVGQVLEEALTQVGKGALPAVEGTAAGELAAAGIAGVSKLARGARSVGRAFGTGPAGFALGTLLPAFLVGKPLLDAPGKSKRAKMKAVQGFQALGGGSSSAVLSEIVRQQELAARRQLTMQRFEPDMFRQVLNVLADTGAQPGSLTETEHRIGLTNEVQMPSRRPDKDIKFLLDQLMTEASGPY